MLLALKYLHLNVSIFSSALIATPAVINLWVDSRNGYGMIYYDEVYQRTEIKKYYTGRLNLACPKWSNTPRICCYGNCMSNIFSPFQFISITYRMHVIQSMPYNINMTSLYTFHNISSSCWFCCCTKILFLSNRLVKQFGVSFLHKELYKLPI